jgi:hypothetical protein
MRLHGAGITLIPVRRDERKGYRVAILGKDLPGSV